MNAALPNLDAIVAEVVRRLTATAGSCGCRGAGHAHATGSAPSEQPAASADPAILNWDSRLLTAASLRGRLDAVRAIATGPRTVITPEARDLLKQRGIALLTGNSIAVAMKSNSAQGMPGKSGCTGQAESCHCGCQHGGAKSTTLDRAAPLQPALVGGGTIDPQMAGTIERALVQRGINLELVSAQGLLPILDQLLSRVSQRDARGLLVTEQSAIAICLANRHPQVRAVLVDTLPQLERAMTTVAPNLLVLSPEGKSSFQLVRLAEEFARREAKAASPWVARL